MPHTFFPVTERFPVGIRLRNVGKSYGDFAVLGNVSVSVGAGRSLAVVGESGCGKSTLLSVIARLQQTDRGSVEFVDKDGLSFFGKYGRMPRLSYVLQDYGLFPWKNAEENLALPLLLQDVSKKHIKDRVFRMLDELGLQGMEKRYPSELSGGQKQRLALGRALISEPELILLDEPFSSVDAINREHLQNLILSLWKKYGFSFVLVTHSAEEAVYLGSTVLSLKKYREGGNAFSLFENRLFAMENMRKSEEYFRLCQKVHASLSEEDDE